MFLERIRDQGPVGENTGIASLCVPVAVHQVLDQASHLGIGRVKGMSSDIEYAASVFDRPTEPSNLQLLFQHHRVALQVKSRRQTRGAGSDYECPDSLSMHLYSLTG